MAFVRLSGTSGTMDKKKITLGFSFMLGFAALLSLLTNSGHAAPRIINGAGATFPFPLYSKWFSDFQKADPSIAINYQSIGSGGGIRQLTDRTIDFGASDAPMTDEQLAKAKAHVLHFPTVLGAVVLTYQVPGLSAPLRFSPETISSIFLGKITRWNDPAIQADNPGVVLPEKLPLLVAHRSDGSGTTALFTEYLSRVSPEWKAKVGSGTAVKWPVGLGAKGNEGVTGLVKNMPGSLGYVELVYATSNRLPVALIKNASGNFVAPTLSAVTTAAQGVIAQLPDDFRGIIVNSPAKTAYPLAGFTYLLIFEKMQGEKADGLKKFLKWAYTNGQKSAEALGYAPLPDALKKKVLSRVDRIQSE